MLFRMRSVIRQDSTNSIQVSYNKTFQKMPEQDNNQQSYEEKYVVYLYQLFISAAQGSNNLNQILNNDTYLLDLKLIDYIIPTLIFLRTTGWKDKDILSVSTKIAYCIKNLPTTESAVNIEIAIKIYEMAITFSTDQKFTYIWAIAVMMLGNAYFERLSGQKKDNIELAIEAYQAAFKIYTEEKQFHEAAMTLMFLGSAYCKRIVGEKDNNIEIAIKNFQEALMFFDYKNFPSEWASIQNELGKAYRNRIKDDKKDNIELAIKYHHAALKVINRDANPYEWAATRNNIGLAYYERIEGDRRNNIELAINNIKAALEVVDRETHSYLWAMCHDNLGIFYRDRIEGKSKDNIELAIDANQKSFEVYTRKNFPYDWALSKNNLAVAYLMRIKGDRKNNIELAIKACTAALEIFSCEDFPNDWALTQTNLGITYHNRIEGNRKHNIELAIEAYKASLKVHKYDSSPQEWAKLKHNLATAYLVKLEDSRENNIELAINAVQAALEVYTRDDFPEQWAMSQNCLGSTYNYRIKGNRDDNIRLAINAYEEALKVYTREAFPQDWASTQNNLASAYCNSEIGDSEYNIEYAIKAYQAASEIYTREDFPRSWATIQNNIGDAYRRRKNNENKNNIKLAIEAHQAALEIYNLQTFPRDYGITQLKLGNLFLNNFQWANAVEAYSEAINAIEIVRNWSNSDDDRKQTQKLAISYYDNLIKACLKTSQIDLAVEYTERFRSRMLVDLVSGKEIDIKDLKPEKQKLIQEYIKLQTKIDRDRRYLSNKSNPQSPLSDNDTPENNRASLQASSDKIIELEREKQLVFQEIRKTDPVLAGEIQVDALEFEQIRQLISDSQTAIVSFYAIGGETHVFIIYQDRESQHYVCEQQETDLKTWLDKHWLEPYETAYDTSKPKSKREKQLQHWIGSVSVVMRKLSQRLNLNRLIEEYLQDIEEIIIIPHGYLHNIPFAALPISDTEFLNDRFRIRHAPSCQILKFCQDRKPVANVTYGTVEDADGSLPGARLEGQKVAQLFDILKTNRLIGEESTVTEYRQLAKRVQALHSSHHANSRLDNPLESALKLANGSITLGELFALAFGRS